MSKEYLTPQQAIEKIIQLAYGDSVEDLNEIEYISGLDVSDVLKQAKLSGTSVFISYMAFNLDSPYLDNSGGNLVEMYDVFIKTGRDIRKMVRKLEADMKDPNLTEREDQDYGEYTLQLKSGSSQVYEKVTVFQCQIHAIFNT